MKLVGLAVFALLFVLVFYGFKVITMGSSDLPSIDVTTLAQRLKSAMPPVLIDVRESYEFEAGHIDGAKLIPLGSLASHLAEVPRDKPVVLICRSGNRSAHATALLIQQGYTNVENITGGMNAWARSRG
ncbi:MAG: rhodanese-like domain-containing protein [Bdellovibrionales bacterium]